MVSCFRLCKHPKPKAKRMEYLPTFSINIHKNTPNVGKHAIHGWYGKWYHRCPVRLYRCNKFVFHYPIELDVTGFWGDLSTIFHLGESLHIVWAQFCSFAVCNDHWARTAVQAACEFSAISVISLRVKYHDHPWSQCCLSVQDDARCGPSSSRAAVHQEKPRPLSHANSGQVGR